MLELEIDDLRVTFPGQRGRAPVRAVDGVTLSIDRDEALGIVGESGSGKSTVARAVAGLVAPTGGAIRLDGRVIGARRDRAIRRRIQMVFQDPGSSLDPRQRVGAAVAEPLLVHRAVRRRDVARRVGGLLEQCGLPAAFAGRYPHQLSGGQKQRVAIARAVALEPDLLVCDEPTSALDVSIQARILALLAELRARTSMACLFISHDIAVVAGLCERIAVMRAGRVVETGPSRDVIESPKHAFTRELLDAVPRGLCDLPSG